MPSSGIDYNWLAQEESESVIQQNKSNGKGQRIFCVSFSM